MPKYSEASKGKLDTCHPRLQRVFTEVIKRFDCTILNGYRPQLAQERMFKEGKSKAHYGESPHNYQPALAVDVAPYPIDWRGEKELLAAAKVGNFTAVLAILHNMERWALFAGQVIATARSMGIEIKWGGDWDRDTHLSDQRFDDFPHFELVGWRERV